LYTPDGDRSVWDAMREPPTIATVRILGIVGITLWLLLVYMPLSLNVVQNAVQRENIVGKQESQTHAKRHKSRTVVRAVRIANWSVMIAIIIVVVNQYYLAASSDIAWTYRMAIRSIGPPSAISAFSSW
jgi:uncharacterized membrane protein